MEQLQGNYHHYHHYHHYHYHSYLSSSSLTLLTNEIARQQATLISSISKLQGHFTELSTLLPQPAPFLPTPLEELASIQSTMPIPETFSTTMQAVIDSIKTWIIQEEQAIQKRVNETKEQLTTAQKVLQQKEVEEGILRQTITREWSEATRTLQVSQQRYEVSSCLLDDNEFDGNHNNDELDDEFGGNNNNDDDNNNNNRLLHIQSNSFNLQKVIQWKISFKKTNNN